MASVANREATSAMAKGLGWCAALGTFFSILDTARNRSLHNLASVCIFGFACWALLKAAVLIKRPSFANVAKVQITDTVVGRSFGAPAWVRPAIWVGLFIVVTSICVELFRYRFALHLKAGGIYCAVMAAFALYLLGCQQAERFGRSYLRRWYPDQPQVAIGAEGMWVTGTLIPWTSIGAINRRMRRVQGIGVDTIVVQARGARGVEGIEIDLSDSVEDPQALYAKLRSAAAAHGAKLLPEGQGLGARPVSARAARARARAAREKYDEWRASLPQEIAKTEAQLGDVKARIAASEAKIRDLEAALSFRPDQRELTGARLEQARANLRASLSLRDSLVKLLATQRSALEKRR
jgi:hypothetical protein